MSFQFNLVSLFAGCGGSSLGYQMAGGKCLLAVEWDDKAVETYRANFPDTLIYHGDIERLSVEECLKLTGLKPGELDILDGSPPCQGFSTAGKRKLTDDRNQLFEEYIRLLQGLKPKVFVMENVSGMVKGKMKWVFAETMKELKASGYNVKCRLMNAKYYGVPQDRKRVILLGVRNDLRREPIYPVPQTRAILFREVATDLKGNNPGDRMLSSVVKQIVRIQPDKWSTDRKMYLKIKGNDAGRRNLFWAGWDRTCGTIIKEEISMTGIVHPDRERYLSGEEIKRVGSFPDDFEFRDRSTTVKQIGNSVPPLLMKAIAEHIRDNFLRTK